MALREELEQQGLLFFKWRSWWPFVTAGFFVFAFRDFHFPYGSHQWDRLWELFCLSISLVGLCVRAYAASCAPRGTSGRNLCEQRAASLNVTGLYSVVRHPLYLGNFLAWIGIVLLARSAWFLCVAVLLFWIYYERIIFAEEEFLRRKFGRTYLEWAEKTLLFVPNLKNWKPPALSFSWRNALRREHSSFFAIIAWFAALDMAGETIVAGKLAIDWLWVAIFAFGLVVYVSLLFAKKKTRILDVPGR